MTTAAQDGALYGIIWSFGKSPFEPSDIGLRRWDVELRSSQRGRAITLASLRRIGITDIFTFETSLSELMGRAQVPTPIVSDQAKRRSAKERMGNLRMVYRAVRKKG